MIATRGPQTVELSRPMLCAHCTPFEVLKATSAVHVFNDIRSMWCDSRGVMCDLRAWSGRLTRRRNAPFGAPLSALSPACYKRMGGKSGNVANARRNHPSKARKATQHNVKESEATQRKATAATSGGGWRRSATERTLGKPNQATQRNETKSNATHSRAEHHGAEQRKRVRKRVTGGNRPSCGETFDRTDTSGNKRRRLATGHNVANHPANPSKQSRGERSRVAPRRVPPRCAEPSRAEPSRAVHSRAERSRAEQRKSPQWRGRARQGKANTNQHEHHESEVDTNSEGRRRAATWYPRLPSSLPSPIHRTRNTTHTSGDGPPGGESLSQTK